MDHRLEERRLPASSVLRTAFAGVLLAGLTAGTQSFADPKEQPMPLTVPKAKCGPHDHPETALQGQVPASLRAAGFQGFSCNLELLSQTKNDGANWQTAEWRQGVGRGN